jgi:DNA-binding winged helix-turn-helix (wHTH) protein/tetratricopeptide (TPR) repeat protein
MAAGVIRFAEFELDRGAHELRHNGRVVPLERIPFDLLLLLVERPGQLRTREEIHERVWGSGVFLDSEAAINTAVRKVRRALNDDARNPHFIIRVQGMGYRFGGTVEPPQRDESSTLTQPNAVFGVEPEGRLMVGREEALARIRRLFAKASAGIRQVVFITGEPGIGKTTFARSFLGAIARDRVEHIGYGQCVEQYGSAEPYMPVLEGLTRLCRGPQGAALLAVVRRVAPSWLAQMPSLMSESEHEALQPITQGMTQQRMLREMAEALEVMAAETPLVLLLEDLHWSDPSTLDLIATVARRSEPACLMVLGTYRPVEILGGEHPLRAMKEELELHQQCIEMRLPLLSQADVGTYLARRFPDGEEHLSPLGIYARSEGNPLLMVNVVDYLAEQGSLTDADKVEAPRNIRQMIERNLQRLSDDEQHVLEAASVAGVEFSVAPIAAALDRPLGEIDACCTRLARGQQFVDAAGVVNWPDGTVAPSFRFHHALYQEVLYSRLPMSHRVELHRRIAVWAEQAYGTQATEIANELAHHYVSSHQPEKAVEYLYHAAQRATSRSAFPEALALARAALALIPKLPQNNPRDHREFELLGILVHAAKATEGWGSPKTIAGGERMLALARISGDEAELEAALRSTWYSHFCRGRYAEALELAEQMLWVAERGKRQAPIADAKTALGWLSLWMGRAGDAVRLFDGALTHCPDGAGRSSLIGMEPVAETFAFSAEGWWVAGYPDRAMHAAQSAVQRSRDLRLPLSLAQTLFPASWVATWCGQYEAACRLATEGAEIARHEGYPSVLAGCSFVLGWAAGLQGRFEQGTALIRRGTAGWTLAMCVFQHVMLAEVCLRAGQPRDALAALAKFDELARANGEHYGESEAPRLRAEALMMIDRSNETVAEQHLRDAVAISVQQGAKSMELRATTSLARLLAKHGKRDEARTMLAEIYNWFTEGFDTVDLKDAKALLDKLNQ